MFATQQPDQHAPSTGDTAYRRVCGYAQPYGVGLRPLNGGQHPTEAPTLIVDQRRTNERFIRETKPVRDFLVRNAVRLTRQRADAEDLVQETLLKAYVSFDTYREGTHLKSWLSRIMSNAWIDRHRSAQRRPVEQLSAEVTDTRSTFDGSHAGSGGRVDSAETQALQSLPSDTELALQALPDELRTIVYYACVADYRNTEIAALLDIPVGTVGSRLHRGKALLREALADPGGDCRSPR
jgi:RNA polymerase sigma-70 factor, ECF subfamily